MGVAQSFAGKSLNIGFGEHCRVDFPSTNVIKQFKDNHVDWERLLEEHTPLFIPRGSNLEKSLAIALDNHVMVVIRSHRSRFHIQNLLTCLSKLQRVHEVQHKAIDYLQELPFFHERGRWKLDHVMRECSDTLWDDISQLPHIAAVVEGEVASSLCYCIEDRSAEMSTYVKNLRRLPIDKIQLRAVNSIIQSSSLAYSLANLPQTGILQFIRNLPGKSDLISLLAWYNSLPPGAMANAVSFVDKEANLLIEQIESLVQNLQILCDEIVNKTISISNAKSFLESKRKAESILREVYSGDPSMRNVLKAAIKDISEVVKRIEGVKMELDKFERRCLLDKGLADANNPFEWVAGAVRSEDSAISSLELLRLDDVERMIEWVNVVTSSEIFMLEYWQPALDMATPGGNMPSPLSPARHHGRRVVRRRRMRDNLGDIGIGAGEEAVPESNRLDIPKMRKIAHEWYKRSRKPFEENITVERLHSEVIPLDRPINFILDELKYLNVHLNTPPDYRPLIFLAHVQPALLVYHLKSSILRFAKVVEDKVIIKDVSGRDRLKEFGVEINRQWRNVLITRATKELEVLGEFDFDQIIKSVELISSLGKWTEDGNVTYTVLNFIMRDEFKELEDFKKTMELAVLNQGILITVSSHLILLRMKLKNTIFDANAFETFQDFWHQIMRDFSVGGEAIKMSLLHDRIDIIDGLIREATDRRHELIDKAKSVTRVEFSHVPNPPELPRATFYLKTSQGQSFDSERFIEISTELVTTDYQGDNNDDADADDRDRVEEDRARTVFRIIGTLWDNFQRLSAIWHMKYVLKGTPIVVSAEEEKLDKLNAEFVRDHRIWWRALLQAWRAHRCLTFFSVETMVYMLRKLQLESLEEKVHMIGRCCESHFPIDRQRMTRAISELDPILVNLDGLEQLEGGWTGLLDGLAKLLNKSLAQRDGEEGNVVIDWQRPQYSEARRSRSAKLLKSDCFSSNVDDSVSRSGMLSDPKIYVAKTGEECLFSSILAVMYSDSTRCPTFQQVYFADSCSTSLDMIRFYYRWLADSSSYEIAAEGGKPTPYILVLTQDVSIIALKLLLSEISKINVVTRIPLVLIHCGVGLVSRMLSSSFPRGNIFVDVRQGRDIKEFLQNTIPWWESIRIFHSPLARCGKTRAIYEWAAETTCCYAKVPVYGESTQELLSKIQTDIQEAMFIHIDASFACSTEIYAKIFHLLAFGSLFDDRRPDLSFPFQLRRATDIRVALELSVIGPLQKDMLSLFRSKLCTCSHDQMLLTKPRLIPSQITEFPEMVLNEDLIIAAFVVKAVTEANEKMIFEKLFTPNLAVFCEGMLEAFGEGEVFDTLDVYLRRNGYTEADLNWSTFTNLATYVGYYVRQIIGFSFLQRDHLMFSFLNNVGETKLFILAILKLLLHTALNCTRRQFGVIRDDNPQNAFSNLLKQFEVQVRWTERHQAILVTTPDSGGSLSGINFHGSDNEAMRRMFTSKGLQVLKLHKIDFSPAFSDQKINILEERQDFLTAVTNIAPFSSDIMTEEQINHRVDSILGNERLRQYVLTNDNFMKMLLIMLRLSIGQPIILNGETGIGKTALLRFLFEAILGKENDKYEDMTLNGDTSREEVMNKILGNKDDGFRNRTIFFDEFNTAPLTTIALMKEILCDHTCNGIPLPKNVRVLGAINPYRLPTGKYDDIAGFDDYSGGNEVRGREVPCVYRVNQIPGSMMDYIFDFDYLEEQQERPYLTKIILSQLDINEWKNLCIEMVVRAHIFTRRNSPTGDERSAVSLRDAKRFSDILKWVLVDPVADNMFVHTYLSDGPRFPYALSIAMTMAYAVRFKYGKRREFYDHIEESFNAVHQELDRIDLQSTFDVVADSFVKLFTPPEDYIASNGPLKENLLFCFICACNKMPLFIVGLPGTSKSLSVEMLINSLRSGENPLLDKRNFFGLKQFYYQCSRNSTTKSLKLVFDDARILAVEGLQVGAPLVVLDEVGLAEQSEHRPLKVLHAELEKAVNAEERAVAVIALSNWRVDPAQMNRGILLNRPPPMQRDLENTASQIFSAIVKEAASDRILDIIGCLTSFYESISNQNKRLFSLRDFYYLIRQLSFRYRDNLSRSLTMDDIWSCVSRNFASGEVEIDRKVLEAFHTAFRIPMNSTRSFVSLLPANLMVRHNLEDIPLGKARSRHLLVLNRNMQALPYIRGLVLKQRGEYPEVIFGSSFSGDFEANQRTLSQFNIAMSRGRVVILCNGDQLFESLYFVFNQNVTLHSSASLTWVCYGSKTVERPVGDNFRVILLMDTSRARGIVSPAILSRFEKQMLTAKEMLSEDAEAHCETLEQIEGDYRNLGISSGSLFVGYHEDFFPSLAIRASLEEKWGYDDLMKRIRALLRPSGAITLMRNPGNRMFNGPESDVREVEMEDNLKILSNEFLSYVLNNWDGLGSVYENAIRNSLNMYSVILTYSSSFGAMDGLCEESFGRDGFRLVNLNTVKKSTHMRRDVIKARRNCSPDENGRTPVLIALFDAMASPLDRFFEAKLLVEDLTEKARKDGTTPVRVIFIVFISNDMSEDHFSFSFEVGWEYYFVDDIFPNSLPISTLVSAKSAVEVYNSLHRDHLRSLLRDLVSIALEELTPKGVQMTEISRRCKSCIQMLSDVDIFSHFRKKLVNVAMAASEDNLRGLVWDFRVFLSQRGEIADGTKFGSILRRSFYGVCARHVELVLYDLYEDCGIERVVQQPKRYKEFVINMMNIFDARPDIIKVKIPLLSRELRQFPFSNHILAIMMQKGEKSDINERIRDLLKKLDVNEGIMLDFLHDYFKSYIGYKDETLAEKFVGCSREIYRGFLKNPLEQQNMLITDALGLLPKLVDLQIPVELISIVKEIAEVEISLDIHVLLRKICQKILSTETISHHYYLIPQVVFSLVEIVEGVIEITEAPEDVFRHWIRLRTCAYFIHDIVIPLEEILKASVLLGGKKWDNVAVLKKFIEYLENANVRDMIHNVVGLMYEKIRQIVLWHFIYSENDLEDTLLTNCREVVLRCGKKGGFLVKDELISSECPVCSEELQVQSAQGHYTDFDEGEFMEAYEDYRRAEQYLHRFIEDFTMITSQYAIRENATAEEVRSLGILLKGLCHNTTSNIPEECLLPIIIRLLSLDSSSAVEDQLNKVIANIENSPNLLFNNEMPEFQFLQVVMRVLRRRRYKDHPTAIVNLENRLSLPVLEDAARMQQLLATIPEKFLITYDREFSPQQLSIPTPPMTAVWLAAFIDSNGYDESFRILKRHSDLSVHGFDSVARMMDTDPGIGFRLKTGENRDVFSLLEFATGVQNADVPSAVGRFGNSFRQNIESLAVSDHFLAHLLLHCHSAFYYANRPPFSEILRDAINSPADLEARMIRYGELYFPGMPVHEYHEMWNDRSERNRFYQCSCGEVCYLETHCDTPVAETKCKQCNLSLGSDHRVNEGIRRLARRGVSRSEAAVARLQGKPGIFVDLLMNLDDEVINPFAKCRNLDPVQYRAVRALSLLVIAAISNSVDEAALSKVLGLFTFDERKSLEAEIKKRVLARLRSEIKILGTLMAEENEDVIRRMHFLLNIIVADNEWGEKISRRNLSSYKGREEAEQRLGELAAMAFANEIPSEYPELFSDSVELMSKPMWPFSRDYDFDSIDTFFANVDCKKFEILEYYERKKNMFDALSSLPRALRWLVRLNTTFSGKVSRSISEEKTLREFLSEKDLWDIWQLGFEDVVRFLACFRFENFPEELKHVGAYEDLKLQSFLFLNESAILISIQLVFTHYDDFVVSIADSRNWVDKRSVLTVALDHVEPATLSNLPSLTTEEFFAFVRDHGINGTSLPYLDSFVTHKLKGTRREGIYDIVNFEWTPLFTFSGASIEDLLECFYMNRSWNPEPSGKEEQIYEVLTKHKCVDEFLDVLIRIFRWCAHLNSDAVRRGKLRDLPLITFASMLGIQGESMDVVNREHAIVGIRLKHLPNLYELICSRRYPGEAIPEKFKRELTQSEKDILSEFVKQIGHCNLVMKAWRALMYTCKRIESISSETRIRIMFLDEIKIIASDPLYRLVHIHFPDTLKLEVLVSCYELLREISSETNAIDHGLSLESLQFRPGNSPLEEDFGDQFGAATPREYPSLPDLPEDAKFEEVDSATAGSNGEELKMEEEDDKADLSMGNPNQTLRSDGTFEVFVIPIWKTGKNRHQKKNVFMTTARSDEKWEVVAQKWIDKKVKNSKKAMYKYSFKLLRKGIYTEIDVERVNVGYDKKLYVFRTKEPIIIEELSESE